MSSDRRRSGSIGNGRIGSARQSLDAQEPHMPAPSGQVLEKTPSPPDSTAAKKAVDEVLYSDIGINTLLNRLKQSIASARDFAGFLKKRSSLEEEHAQGLKKLCRATLDSMRRGDTRQGTFSSQLGIMVKVNEKMADNGMQFALSLHQMHEDLTELSNNMERGRKNWKQQGLAAEKKVQDAEMTMEKAKNKYDSLAEDLDRVRTGDKSGGKLFGIKGPKSSAQHEEDLQRKVQASDSDYSSKVQAAQAAKQELTSTTRPQAVRAIQELITECDSALTLQVQKFVSFNEKLMLSNGMLIAPVNSPGSADPPQPSLREVVMKIDNDKDFQNYITSFTSKVPIRSGEIKYEKHPSLQSSQQTPPSARRQSQTLPPVQSQPPPTFSMATQQQQQQQQQSTPPPQQQHVAPIQQQQQQHPHPMQAAAPPYSQYPPTVEKQAPYGEAPPLLSMPSTGTPHFPSTSYAPPMGGPSMATGQQSGVLYGSDGPPSHHGPPGMNPIFGVSLDELFQRDASPVPMVVYQCIQGVDLFGLNVEGIYRVSGTQQHIKAMKHQFNTDAQRVDFRNPEAFQHDVNSVAGLLKEFFRDLPDPLLTSVHYDEFIEAARIPDDTVRRDSMHAIINALPDPNYATLRALALHLHRVQEHSQINRMSTSNLAICLAPTVMGQHRGQMADAPLQAKVVDTILMNVYQIFDED